MMSSKRAFNLFSADVRPYHFIVTQYERCFNAGPTGNSGEANARGRNALLLLSFPPRIFVQLFRVL